MRHLRVIHRANVEIKIFKRLGAHARRLRHARRRPAQHAPARFVDAIILHGPDDFGIKLHAVARHVGIFIHVVRAADGDVSLHFFHAEHFDVADVGGLLRVNAQKLLAADARVARLDERRRARRAHGADEFDGEFVRHVNHVEQDAVAFFQLGGIVHEQVSQFFVTRVGHKFWKA